MMVKFTMRALRINAGLTQEQAAKALGVSRVTIWKWEAHKGYPSIKKLAQMAELYKAPLDSFLIQ